MAYWNRGKVCLAARIAVFLITCGLVIAQDDAEKTSADSASSGSNAASPATTAPNANPANISVNVKVVNVLATVRDKHGNILPNLSRGDFTLVEDGKKETGGHFFEASKKQPIAEIYKTIETELRNQYSLGFTPDKSQSAGYHKLQLKTKQKDDEIQARDGFYLKE